MDLTSHPSDPSREDLCRALFERAADGIFIVDRQARFVEVNPRGCEMAGYSRQEILALSVVDLIPDEGLARDLLDLGDLRAGKTLVSKCPLRCKNTSLLPVEIRSQILPDGRLVCSVHDLAEHQQVEMALRKSEERLDLALKGAELGTWDWHVPTGGERLLAAEREQRLQAETLAEVVLALTSHIDVEDVLDEILHQARRVVPFTAANIALLEDDTFHVVRGYGYEAFGSADLVATFNRPLSDFPLLVATFSRPLSYFPLDDEAIQARKALIVLDTRSEPRWVTPPGMEWVRSYLMVPICSRERVLGFLNLDSDVPGRFTVEDAHRLEPLANAAAIALENARLYNQAQREIAERMRAEAEREKLIADLQAALAQVRRLSGLLPICASCKKIRDDKGYWQQVEVYIHDHAEVEFSHGLCPDCKEKLYPREEYPYLYTEPTEQDDENLPGATRRG
jgi:PAS domain S-box-containing protein